MPAMPSAASATRPTGTTSRPTASSSRKGRAPAISVAFGRRFEAGSPGRCGCVGTTFQRRTSSSMQSSASTRWTIVAVASAGPVPVSCRSDVKGTPLTRAPRYPAASPTRRIGTSARCWRYAASRSHKVVERAYWLNVAPIRATASRLTKTELVSSMPAPRRHELVCVPAQWARTGSLGGRSRRREPTKESSRTERPSG